MARTQSPDYDKRREAILEQAANLYARYGFLGASVADLAAACKTSKSLVYHYYPSKEDVLYGVMSSHLDDLVAISRAVMAQSDATAAERLKQLTLNFMQVYVGAAASHKVLLNELENLPTAKRKAIIKRQREIISVVEQLLREIKPELTEYPNLTLPVSMLFFGMINWTHTWFNAKGPVSAERLATMAYDILVHGLDTISLNPQPS